MTFFLRKPWSVVVLSLSAVSFAGCGGSGDTKAATDGVASLSGGSTTTTAAGATDAGDFRTALLKYAKCMRTNGVDMADPQFDANGRPQFGGGGPGGPGGGQDQLRSDADFEKAQTACSSIMEGARGQFQQSAEQQAEHVENLLAFAECMRDEGIDFPDPQFGADGRPQFGTGDAGGRGGGPGAFANDDPKSQAARTACQRKLGNTIGGPGRGPGGAPPNGATTTTGASNG